MTEPIASGSGEDMGSSAATRGAAGFVKGVKQAVLVYTSLWNLFYSGTTVGSYTTWFCMMNKGVNPLTSSLVYILENCVFHAAK